MAHTLDPQTRCAKLAGALGIAHGLTVSMPNSGLFGQGFLHSPPSSSPGPASAVESGLLQNTVRATGHSQVHSLPRVPTPSW